MFEELIKEVQAAVKPELIEVNGDEYVSRPVYAAPEQPRAQTLSVQTLQAIKDYVAKDVDNAVSVEALFIHVESPTLVNLFTYLNENRKREALISAGIHRDPLPFGMSMRQTEFITKLQSQFVPSEERDRLQKFVAKLTSESGVQLEDDGVSQTTVAKAGITAVERATVQNPFTLAPYRTFPEIEQPTSEFILRLHRSDEGVPGISLHQADNDAWKLTAIESIKTWLANSIDLPILA